MDDGGDALESPSESTSDRWTAEAQFKELVALTLVVCTVMLTVNLSWLGWSVRKHGWRKRSLRRYSYILFAIVLGARLFWSIAVLVELGQPSGVEVDEQASWADQRALQSPTVLAIGRVAFCAHFLVFSMLVCGWADSTWMMMSGLSLQPLALKASTIFYHLGRPFAAINAANCLVSLGALVPPAFCPAGRGTAEAAAASCRLLARQCERLGVGAMAGFSLVLAVASAVAGTAISCKIRDIAEGEPSLRPFAYAKLLKARSALRPPLSIPARPLMAHACTLLANPPRRSYASRACWSACSHWLPLIDCPSLTAPH